MITFSLFFQTAKGILNLFVKKERRKTAEAEKERTESMKLDEGFIERLIIKIEDAPFPYETSDRDEVGHIRIMNERDLVEACIEFSDGGARAYGVSLKWNGRNLCYRIRNYELIKAKDDLERIKDDREERVFWITTIGIPVGLVLLVLVICLLTAICKS